MTKCPRPHPVGWVCVTAPHVEYEDPKTVEACGLVPSWWNIVDKIRWYKNLRGY